MFTRLIDRRTGWVVLGALLATAGCGGGPFEMVSASGTVAYEDGEPIPSSDYRLKFVPQVESPDGKLFPRPATAMVDGTGAFGHVTTYKYKDGLVNGKHRVYFRIGEGADGKSLVPEEYLAENTTPLEVDVSKSRELEIRIPRP